MSAPQWKPGDVAVIRYAPAASEGRALYTGVPGFEWTDGEGTAYAEGVAVRPLVVIDPEDREQVEDLIRAFWANGNDECDDTRAMTDALRSHIAPERCDVSFAIGDVVIACDLGPGHPTTHCGEYNGADIGWTA